MGESLIQQCYVGDESHFGCKTLSVEMIMTVSTEEVPANSVPAAAVIRGVQAIIGIIGRKAYAGGLLGHM